MALKRRQLLILGGLTIGGGLGGAAFSGILKRQSEAIAPTPPINTNNPSKPVKATSTIARSPNPAPKGLYAPPRGDVRIILISDLNSAYGSTDYIEQVKQAIAFVPDWEPDLVLCGGDMVAGQDSALSTSEINAMWQGFDKHIAAPIRKAKLPFGFTIGNHDASGSLYGGGKYAFESDRSAATKYWNDPKHDANLNFVDRAGFPFYYTFQQNDIFFLVWDASTATIPSTQLQWAEKSLASEVAQKSKLRMAIGHLPLYAVAKGRETSGNYLDEADRLRGLLEKYQVHTYISGHHHAYYPAHKGKLELLHAGVLGDGPRRLLSGDLAPSRTVTAIDIKLATSETIYTTYDMDTLKVVEQSTLPPYIDAPNGRITRRDISI